MSSKDQNHPNEEGFDMGGEVDDSKTFPMKLVEILADERYQEAICWLPHGRAFIIRNRKLFAETVMPLHFSRKAKYSSFTRKLNRWNFVRVSSGPEIGAYYHEFFLRDKPHLAAQMFCKNARTKLAMADEATPKPTAAAVLQKQEEQQHQESSSAASSQQAAASMPNLPQDQQQAQFPPGLLQILQKDPEDNKFQNMGVSNNLQLLERQMQFLQEEHAQRVLLQRMAANRMQQQQLLQQQAAVGGMPMPVPQGHSSFNPAMAAAAQAGGVSPGGNDINDMEGPVPLNAQQQQAQIMRMRQMMDLRDRQRQGLAPTNHRASAA